MAGGTRTAGGLAAAGWSPLGLLWLAAAVLSPLPLFGFGLAGLAAAWTRPEYSHGPVIPLLSFYMFLHEMKAVPPLPAGTRRQPLARGGGDRARARAGARRQPRADQRPGLLRADRLGLRPGARRLRGAAGPVFWPSVLHLVFMLPLPQFLYWQVSTSLQFVSSEVGVALVRGLGVPVYLEGNVIDLGVYQLQVAEACSGLRYLFPIMSFTYVFAVLYRGPVWHKLVLLLSAVPLAVLMNAVRIGVIGLLVDRHGIAQAEGFLHVFEGWVIFLLCIAVLFGMAKAMQRLSGDRRRLGAALDLDFSGLAAELGRIRGVEASAALVAAAGLTAALSLGFALAPERVAAVPAREQLRALPAERRGRLGAGGRAERRLTPAIERCSAPTTTWRRSTPRPTAARRSTSSSPGTADQTDGNAIHSPAVCLPGAGWEVSAIRTGHRAAARHRDRVVRLNRAVIRKGLETQVVYYWFAGRGRRSPTTSPPSSRRWPTACGSAAPTAAWCG